MKVCVIGAGIVGCATAYQLARRGAEVTLLDAADGPGLGTSFANGAQLSYSYVEPFASPGTLVALPKLLLSRNSAVRFYPQADWRQWWWGLQFLRACTRASATRGTRQLLAMAHVSRLTLAQWMADERWSFDHAVNGKLVLCPSQAALRHQEDQVHLQASMGCWQEILDFKGCVAKEPALGASAVKFEGGVWTEDECVADPRRLCLELVSSLQRLGGRACYRVSARGFIRQGNRVIAVQTDRGDVLADSFVLAAGPSAVGLAQSMGIRLPIHPIKGYSITVPFLDNVRPPRVSVTDLGRKTVFAPLGGRLRVAAMAEVGATSLTVPPTRVEAMVSAVEAVYPGLCDLSSPELWAGLRPATPTSVPIVGRWKDSNLVLNVGHGALGLTLAAGSAAAVSDALLG